MELQFLELALRDFKCSDYNSRKNTIFIWNLKFNKIDKKEHVYLNFAENQVFYKWWMF